MVMRAPPTIEGTTWLGKFNENFKIWLDSSFSDDDALISASKALNYLFERCPDYADCIQQIVLSSLYVAKFNGVYSTALIPLVEVGYEAVSMELEDSTDIAIVDSLISLVLAEACIANDQFHEGFDAIKRVDKRLEKIPPRHPTRNVLIAYKSHLKGKLNELGLELNDAVDCYQYAGAAAALILKDKTTASNYGNAWLGYIFQDTKDGMMEQARPQFLNHFYIEITSIQTKSLLGLARIGTGMGGGDDGTTLIPLLTAIISHYGLPRDIDPIEVYPILKKIPPTVGLEPVEAFVNTVLEHRSESAPDQANEWSALMNSALARSFLLQGDTEGAENLHNDALSSLDQLDSPLVIALTLGNIIENIGIHSHDLPDPEVERFLDAVNDLAEIQDQVPLRYNLKAMLDGPISVAIEWMFKRWMTDPTPSNRVRFSGLLDTLRQRQMIIVPSEDSYGEVVERTIASMGLAAASDYLMRIHCALNGFPSTAVVILQTLRNGVLFITLNGDPTNPFILSVTGGDYQEAGQSLITGVLHEFEHVGESLEGEDNNGLMELGATLYGTLPDDVRTIIQNSSNIFIVPDFRTNLDNIPYELMHDGEMFLGESKVICRCISLRHVSRILERTNPQQERKRGLVVSASKVQDYIELKFAPEEIAEVRAILQSKGWDAPPIEENRVSNTFIMDRLQYVSLLHIMAHGESTPEGEAIVLPRHRWLTVDDILRKNLPHLPFIYLSNCSLGRTRYLGGGVSKGIMFTFIEAGAPATIASLTPILDISSYELATEFYNKARTMSIGDSLKEARRNLNQQGVSPALWGTTILVGDPAYRLPGLPRSDDRSTDVATDLLNAYYNIKGVDDHREGAYISALDALVQRPDDSRLMGAMSLVQSMSHINDLEDPSQLEEIKTNIRLADELNHLPTSTMLRMVLAEHYTSVGDGPEMREALKELLWELERIEIIDDDWSQVKMKYLAIMKRMKLADKDRAPSLMGPYQDEETKAEMDSIVDVLYSVQEMQERAVGTVEVRETEETLEDIAWNSVVIGHPNRFEDERECTAYCKQLSKKIHKIGELSKESAPYDHIILTGGLRFLWSIQNRAYLDPEIARGQTGTVMELIEAVKKDWSPPAGAPWFDVVGTFPHKVDEVLAYIHSLAYEEVYQHLDGQFRGLLKHAKDMLTWVSKEHPDALGGCAAYLMGTFVVKNTFSPRDGSVPVAIGKRMSNAFHELSMSGEAYLQDQLWKGFQSAREHKLDELDRWRMDISPDQYSEITKKVQERENQ